MRWEHLCSLWTVWGRSSQDWTRARFLSLARSKLRLSIVWAYSEQKTENVPRWHMESVRVYNCTCICFNNCRGNIATPEYVMFPSFHWPPTIWMTLNKLHDIFFFKMAWCNLARSRTISTFSADGYCCVLETCRSQTLTPCQTHGQYLPNPSWYAKCLKSFYIK